MKDPIINIASRRRPRPSSGRQETILIPRYSKHYQISAMKVLIVAAALLLLNTATIYAFTASFAPKNGIERPPGTGQRLTALSSSATSSSSSSDSPRGPPLGGLGRSGLSKYHQSIMSRMVADRQRFVTGKYPVICQVAETPTLKWLGGGGDNKNRATSQLLVNGTSVDRSLASYDRFQWLDDDEREEMRGTCALVSWELLAVISISKPGYVRIMPGVGAGSTAASMRTLLGTNNNSPLLRWERWKLLGGDGDRQQQQDEPHQELQHQLNLDVVDNRQFPERLWVTGFSLTGRAGHLNSIDTNSGHIESVSKRTALSLLWPNEVSPVPSTYISKPVESSNSISPLSSSMQAFADNLLRDAVLVSDGFLVPGKERGGIYVVKQPGNPNTEWNVCLTGQRNSDRWFYHR